MSQIIQSRLINFVVHLTPDINLYQATADYLANLLLPCALPSWSHYVEYVILAEFVIMFFQSSYILHCRSKTKKIYHIDLNEMGLIRFDRANHCGLCYLLYSTIAVIEIISQPFVRSGHIDQGWPDFILGAQFTLTIAGAGVVLWLAICHCLSVRGYIIQRNTPGGKLLLTTVAWALNVFLVMSILGPSAIIVISCYQVAMEYHRIRQLVLPVINILRQKASTCSPNTCSITNMVPQALPLVQASSHIDLLVHYTEMVAGSYLIFFGCILVIYIPVLYQLFQSFKAQRRLFRASQQQQDRCFANTLTEFGIIAVTFSLSVYAATLLQGGRFIFNPTYFLDLSLGINGVTSTLGNCALYLIIWSDSGTDVEPPKVHIPILPFSSSVGFAKSDENTSPCYPYL